jgi:hypothetical protein
MARAADLPQADASSLVDREVLEAQVKDMYRQVAREQDAALHFEVGRPLASRVGYPSGLALADIVSGKPLKERTRRVELWAACIAGAIPLSSYMETIEAAGFRIEATRTNDYNFISERALDACSTYGVESISLAAIKAT